MCSDFVVCASVLGREIGRINNFSKGKSALVPALCSICEHTPTPAHVNMLFMHACRSSERSIANWCSTPVAEQAAAIAAAGGQYCC
jgi:hypothetical protein